MYNNQKRYLAFILFFLSGLFFFFIKKEWIIFNFNRSAGALKEPDKSFSRKEVVFYSFKDDRLYSDTAFIIWKNNVTDNIKNIVNAWIAFVYDEQITQRKSVLDAVAISQGVAYLSFDSPILSQEWSALKKYRFIEYLLKTIKGNGIDIGSVSFLVRHKSMEDAHLDFLQPWPLDGFSS